MIKKSIAIIGGGSASLMLAGSIDTQKFDVIIYEKNKALGRKFLVAGDGGFNLTHSEEISNFITRYVPRQFITPFINHFSNQDLRDWLHSLGIETFVGTSKRVFPKKGIKPIQVLKAFEQLCINHNVKFQFGYTWKGWKDKALFFENHLQQSFVTCPDIVVFALGGASWKVTGSDGTWLNFFNEKQITTVPFLPSNCAYQINWDATLIHKHAGSALKNCCFSCNEQSKKGEVVVTKFGIEGNAVYALSPNIREELMKQRKALLFIDFKPEFSKEDILLRFQRFKKTNMKSFLKDCLHLTDLQIDLLKNATNKETYNSINLIADKIKSFEVTIIDFSPIDQAISTVGGIHLDELNPHLELKKLPNHYCIGEMIDWDAPTGGYLLQACFSMGKYLANYLNQNN